MLIISNIGWVSEDAGLYDAVEKMSAERFAELTKVDLQKAGELLKKPAEAFGYIMTGIHHQAITIGDVLGLPKEIEIDESDRRWSHCKDASGHIDSWAIADLLGETYNCFIEGFDRSDEPAA